MWKGQAKEHEAGSPRKHFAVYEVDSSSFIIHEFPVPSSEFIAGGRVRSRIQDAGSTGCREKADENCIILHHVPCILHPFKSP
jgi:hypothetical protein